MLLDVSRSSVVSDLRLFRDARSAAPSVREGRNGWDARRGDGIDGYQRARGVRRRGMDEVYVLADWKCSAMDHCDSSSGGTEAASECVSSQWSMASAAAHPLSRHCGRALLSRPPDRILVWSRRAGQVRSCAVQILRDDSVSSNLRPNRGPTGPVRRRSGVRGYSRHSEGALSCRNSRAQPHLRPSTPSPTSASGELESKPNRTARTKHCASAYHERTTQLCSIECTWLDRK